MNFSSFGLKNEIFRAIDSLGFEHATPIQEKAIPRLLTGNTDVIGLAQTGTGKTAAFGLPLIQLIDFESKKVQGLILCPTRELCLQIANDFRNDLEPAAFRINKKLKDVRCRLEEFSAGPVRLSGSGAAMFTMFDTRDQALQFMQRIQSLDPNLTSWVVRNNAW